MKTSNDGRRGGLLNGDSHSDKSGGIEAVVVTDNNRPVLLEGGEVIINKEASALHKEELSRINQSAGNGVPIMEQGGAVESEGDNKTKKINTKTKTRTNSDERRNKTN